MMVYEDSYGPAKGVSGIVDLGNATGTGGRLNFIGDLVSGAGLAGCGL